MSPTSDIWYHVSFGINCTMHGNSFSRISIIVCIRSCVNWRVSNYLSCNRFFFYWKCVFPSNGCKILWIYLSSWMICLENEFSCKSSKVSFCLIETHTKKKKQNEIFLLKKRGLNQECQCKMAVYQMSPLSERFFFRI